MHKPLRRAEITLLLVAIVWGVNHPVVKYALQHLPPQAFNVARLAAASVLALFALWLSRSHRPIARGDRGRFFRVSALGFFVFQFFFTEGIQRTTAGNASFMLCLMPVSVLLLNKLFGFEPLRRAVVLGVALSVAGVLLIVIGAGREISLIGAHLAGALLIFVSQAGNAYYTVFSKELLHRYSSTQVTAYMIVITTGLLLCASLPEVMAVQWSAVPVSAWLCVIYSGVIALCLCNFLWIWGCGVIGSSRVAIFGNVSPIFAVITGHFLLGESFGPLQAAGAACIFAGVYITRRQKPAASQGSAG
ncbi:DMT family transporter [Propionivibrio dicarboxylicus]|uniref:Permease of the drug/metabolite transporter (DMT) superfamily n=1 Tax=Propionivibrio dicarboxylicus TaxID=83767 RepID=A0A1G8HZS9_9RHOO|nr:DMT family transporter [Propionivibrio dicarboxylicus]SDI12107.1 Permease of the drug/metabolite transporter (DMT) superfamily [Propionivibrio dicarboxylicus]